MSFLNPVNEPVLRFKSTDAGAPQINYNARTAGDVKAVIKGCLVTGYGAKAGAGWSIVNEVDDVAEFVSPSVLMSRHAVKIDDSATATKWYNILDGGAPIVMGPASGVNKAKTGIDPSYASNGWDVVATECGFMLVENVFNTTLGQLVSRITYAGRVKSGLSIDTDNNIAWWCVGSNAPASSDGIPAFFFDATKKTDKYYSVGSTTINKYSHPCIDGFKALEKPVNLVEIDLVGDWWLLQGNIPIAKQPGCVLQFKTDGGTDFEFKTGVLEGRPVLFRWPTAGSLDLSTLEISSHAVVIVFLDYWEY